MRGDPRVGDVHGGEVVEDAAQHGRIALVRRVRAAREEALQHRGARARGDGVREGDRDGPRHVALGQGRGEPVEEGQAPGQVRRGVPLGRPPRGRGGPHLVGPRHPEDADVLEHEHAVELPALLHGRRGPVGCAEPAGEGGVEAGAEVLQGAVDQLELAGGRRGDHTTTLTLPPPSRTFERDIGGMGTFEREIGPPSRSKAPGGRGGGRILGGMPATPRTSRTPAGPAVRPAPALPAPSARTVRWEIAIVLGLSLGKSAVYAIVQLIDKATQAPLGEQTTVLNPALADRWAFDLTYQLLGIGFALVPVALVLHLMHLRGRNPFRVLGLDLRRPGRDLAWGLGLFAAIGLGTLGVYAAGRALGITTAIVGSALGESWYQVPVLLLSALRHGLLEEVIVGAWLVDRLGYLQRLRAAGLARDPAPAVPSSWVSAEGLYLPTRAAVVVLALALLRGAYHLYQGIGPGVGNALMGVVFALVFLRVRRVMPLVIAHTLLDAVGFVGYPLLARAGLLG